MRPWNVPPKGKGKGKGKGKSKSKKTARRIAVEDDYGGVLKSAKKACFVCGSSGHLAVNCPEKRSD